MNPKFQGPQADKCRALGEATERRLAREAQPPLTPSQRDKRAASIVRRLAKIGHSTIKLGGHGFETVSLGKLYCHVDRDGDVSISLELGALDEPTAAALLKTLYEEK